MASDAADHAVSPSHVTWPTLPSWFGLVRGRDDREPTVPLRGSDGSAIVSYGAPTRDWRPEAATPTRVVHMKATA